MQQLQDEGIDGYWIKESPDYNTTTAYSRNNAAALLASIQQVVKNRRRAAPIWKLKEDIEKARAHADYLTGWRMNLGGEADRDAAFDAIIDKLKRAYWYLISTQSAFDMGLYDIYPANLSFLTIWSCINEVHELYFHDRKITKSNLEYFARMPFSGLYETYWEIRSGRIIKEPSNMPDKLVEDLVPRDEKGKPKSPGIGKETSRIIWLLHLLSREDLVSRFIAIRRTRNTLEEIHGAQHLTEGPDDAFIIDLVNIWRTLLLQPYSL